MAGGMMLSASVFALADRALRLGQAIEVVAGMLAGALFFDWSARYVSTRHRHFQNWTEADSRQPIVVIGTMFVHSIPEGVAIGVGYATGEMRFGLLLAIAIAVHNIPEGTAVAMPLRARGASLATCFWYAVLTSVPQPLVAVPAFLLISLVQPLLAASLGFAGGAMIFLVVSELLPDSLALLGPRDRVGRDHRSRRDARLHGGARVLAAGLSAVNRLFGAFPWLRVGAAFGQPLGTGGA